MAAFKKIYSVFVILLFATFLVLVAIEWQPFSDYFNLIVILVVFYYRRIIQDTWRYHVIGLNRENKIKNSSSFH